MSQDNWNNRIIGLEYKAANQLQANPKNPRRHPSNQRQALRGSLDTLGWYDVIIENRVTGELIDGHARVEEALTKDETMLLPVLVVEMAEHEQDLALAQHDWITQLADYDRDALDSLLQDVQTDDTRLQAMLSEMASENGLYFGDAPDIPEDLGAQVDRAEELNQEWQVQSGDLWIIPSLTGEGEHRLLCGDCTVEGDVTRVMGGELADATITDPPYNVGIKYGSNTNDKKSILDYVEWCKDWLRFSTNKLVVSTGLRYLVLWDDIHGMPQWLIAWIKRNGQGNNGLGGTNKWDCILTYNCDTDNLPDMIDINNDYSENLKGNDAFLVAKPVALWRYLVERFSSVDDILYEPFGGSGTTMIACEQLSRQCRMIEIEPKYCAVILQRMTDLGCTPTKAD